MKGVEKIKSLINTGQLNNRKLVDTIIYADDQILMATSEDNLQTMAHHLNLIARKYKITISTTKQNQWHYGGTTYRG